MPVPVGVLLNAEYSPAELGRLGRLCEELGYDRLWYTDIRLFRECYIGLAALTTHTTRIQLGPGVTDPYSRHPAVTAATIATLDELCGGRAVLGLGVGGTGFRELGLSTPLPVAALREAVDVIRRLMRGETVSVQGKVVSLRDGLLQFAPVRAHIPIYFATHGVQVARLAGEIADGVMLGNILTPSAVDFYVDQIRRGTTQAGRRIQDVDISLRPEVCISEDEEAARAVMRHRVALRLFWTYPHWDYLERLGVALPASFADIAARGDARQIEESLALVPDSAIDATVSAGNPERVARQLAAALRPGVTRITIRAHGLPGVGIAPVLRTFVEDVVPRLEKPLARARTP